MKPRLFIGNFDFEHQLAEPTRATPDKLKRLNAELVCAWLSIADDGDFIWTPLPLDREFLGRLGSAEFPKAIAVTSLCEVPRNVECVPWGWSADVRRLVDRFGWFAEVPSNEAVRLANSRSTSDQFEQMWNIGLEGAARIESVTDLHNAVRSFVGADDRWVVKAEFGMSARERILGCGPPKPADENWLLRRLDTSRVFFFEPWVERLDEIGIQIDIPRFGQPRLIGFTPMVVDHHGQYAGSWFAFDETSRADDGSLWSQAADIAIRVAEHLQSTGYFGPLGIDAMIYKDRDGERRIRPLQDINARWTMGRLSLGWRRLLEPGELGVWQHGSTNDINALTNDTVSRQIITSPNRVADLPCQRKSRILIQTIDRRG